VQNHLHSADTQQGVILTKALKNAADYWGVNNKHLGDVIGLSEASVSRLKNGQYVIDPKSKSWQLAVLFLRVFRGLDAYMGGNIDNEKRWLKANNHILGGAPLDVMRHVEGLTSVVHYVDYMRGQQ
jgi:hypothetical protein